MVDFLSEIMNHGIRMVKNVELTLHANLERIKSNELEDDASFGLLWVQYFITFTIECY